MADVPYEIERKFVIDEPDVGALDAAATSVSDIEQTYLVNADGHAERVRRRVVRDADGERTQLTHTRKVPVSRGVVEEYEREVDDATYAELLATADPDRRPVIKTRWVVPHAGRVFEIDRIVAPRRLWLMEVELPGADDVDADVELPPFAAGAVEVTGDIAYSNKNLALPPGD
jgi:CYTH domain-containing protein